MTIAASQILLLKSCILLEVVAIEDKLWIEVMLHLELLKQVDKAAPHAPLI